MQPSQGWAATLGLGLAGQPSRGGVCELHSSREFEKSLGSPVFTL